MIQEPLFHHQRYRSEGISTKFIFLGNYYREDGRIYDLKMYERYVGKFIIGRWGNIATKRFIKPWSCTSTDEIFLVAKCKAKQRGYK